MAYSIADISRFGPAARRQIQNKAFGNSKGPDSQYFGETRGNARKFHNKPVSMNGIRFDSKREATRYCELIEKQEQGEIRKLKLQPHFTLIEAYKDAKTGKPERAMQYVADFSYEEKTDSAGWQFVVEDVKGVRTKEYLLKRKAVKEKFGIEIMET